MAKGKKECPECSASHGCRKIKCDCGYMFIEQEREPSPVRPNKKKRSKKKEHPLGHHEASPGLWVYDIPKGMPKIPIPEDLPSGPADNEAIHDYVSYNGLGDCIFEYIAPRKIADPELRKKWKKAREAMLAVWEHLTDEPAQTKSTTRRKNPE